MASKLLEPQIVNNKIVRKYKRLRNARSAWYHDKHAKDLNPLHEGDVVRIKPMVLGKKTWDKGVVTERLDERSYNVDTPAGVLRRNRVHLRKTNEPSAETELANPAPMTPAVTQDDPAHSTTQDKAVCAPTPKKVSNPGPQEANMNTRPVRENRNRLPQKYDGFVMNK